MKKKMTDENLMRISENADRCVNDTDMAIILLCYMLYRVEQPMDEELLYDVAVTGGIINYFTYQDAIQSLLSTGSVERSHVDGVSQLAVTERGIACAKQLKSIAAKSFRDQIVTEAKRAVQRQRNQKDVKLSYESLERGCYLHVTITDQDLVLLKLTLFAPDLEQARQLGQKILSNPPALYHDVIQAVMRDHEVPIDLTDN